MDRMYSLGRGLPRKRGREENDTPTGSTLFVTGLTPTPAPESITSPTSISTPCPNPRLGGELPGTFSDRWSADLQKENENKEDEDEDQDNEDGDDSDDQYHQEKEEFPTHIAYDKCLPGLVQRALALASGLELQLQPYKLHSDAVQAIHHRAQAAQATTEASKPSIMLYGHTGTGKSSTTNSFLDDLSASKAASSGESCTPGPMLFVHSISGQTSSYAADIHFLDEQRRTEILLEHANSYITYTFDADESWSDEEKHHYATRAATALKVFQALFCDQDKFDSPGAIKRYFAENRDDRLGGAIATLGQWATRLLSAYEQRDGHHVLRFETDTAEELNEEISPHIFERNNFDVPMLWPLVDYVCKGLPGSRILCFVDFLDLPGTTDTNTVRAEIAHTFITKASALWTVAVIGRAISDAELDLGLATYGPRFGNNVVVIATRSDADIDDDLARDMETKRQSVGRYWQLGQEIDSLRDDLAATEAALRATNPRKRRKTNANSENEQKLRNRKYDLLEQIKSLSDEQYDELVQVHGAYVARRLKSEKREHLAAGATLAAYAVSNTHYGVHKGKECKDKCLMDVETTNIPALRKEALLLAASRQFHASKVDINDALLALEGAFMWTESPPTKRSESAMSIVDQPAQLLRSILEECRKSSQLSVADQLISPLEKGQNLFTSASLAFATQLKSWHHSSVRAFFARNGTHKTPARGYAVWNDRFTDEQKKALEPRYQNLVTQLFSSVRGGVEKLKASIRDIPEQLNNNADAVPMAIEPVSNTLEGYITQIQLTVNQREVEFTEKLDNIELAATKDVPSGYFTRAMNPMYSEAKTYRGPGCTARMHGLLSGWLGGYRPAPESPFTSVSSGLQRDLNDVTDWITRTLERDIEEILRDMRREFEGILTRQEESPEERQARAALKPFLTQAKPKMDAIRRELLELKLKYGEELSDEEKLMRTSPSGGHARRNMFRFW